MLRRRFGHTVSMADNDTPKVPDPATLQGDPSVLTRTGEFLKAAGLPFEDEEFDGTRELAAL